MDIRIVLLPDSRGDEIFKKFSKEVCKKYPSLFELGKGCISHITLIHSQVEDKNIDKIKDVLYEFSKRTKSILIDFDYSKREVETNNYISIFFKDDEAIVDLRNSLYKELENLVFSTSKFKYLHVTLARLVNPENVESALHEVKKFPQSKLNLTSLGICKVGENGTCRNILVYYKLK